MYWGWGTPIALHTSSTTCNSHMLGFIGVSLPLVLSSCLPRCSDGGKGLGNRYKALELALKGPRCPAQ